MSKRKKVKLSKKVLKEKYPVKNDLGEEVTNFAGRVALVFGIFMLVALSVDLYHLTH